MGRNAKYVQTKKGKMIRQPYPLTMARLNYNVQESRLLLRILEALQPNMTTNVQLNLFEHNSTPVVLMTKSLLPENNQNHSQIKEALKGLREKTVSVKGYDEKDGNFIHYTGLITSFQYFENNTKIVVNIDNLILPSFLELKNGFSRYSIEGAFNSSSVYAMRLYQFISHWKDKSYIDISIDELKEWLSCEKKYALYAHFKSRIIEPAQLEIKGNVYSDLYFTYEELKKGNKVVKIRFYIHPKVAKVELTEKETNTKLDQIKSLLLQYFHFTALDFKEVAELLNKPELYEGITHKIVAVYQHIQKESQVKIENKAKYLIAALLKEFENDL